MKVYKVKIKDSLGNIETITIHAENKHLALVKLQRDYPLLKLFGNTVLSLKLSH